MKKILLAVSIVTLASFSLDVDARKTESKCVRKDFAPTTAVKIDQSGKLQSRTSYYKINAGDCVLGFCNLFARYVFQISYTFDPTINKVTKIDSNTPAILNHVEVLGLDRDVASNESFSQGDGNHIKIEKYAPTIDSYGNGEIEIKWSYIHSMGGSGAPDADSGTSIIRIDGMGSWVDSAGGKCLVGANYSGLQKIGKKL